MHWWVANFLNKLGEMGPWIQTPLHLVFEEAPMLAPQTGSLYQRDCKAAMAQCARVCRNFGVGMTVVAQRASAISKDVLTQCGTVFAMRIAARLDRRSLTDWVASNVADVDVDETLKQLSVMHPGHWIVLSPTWGPDVSGNTFRSLPRTTYHPDPRKLAENRAVVLKAMPPSKEIASTWRAMWNRVCGVAGLMG
jgi:DNA helicase HerA-like ATPase